MYRKYVSLVVAFLIGSTVFAQATVEVQWTGGDSHQQFNIAKSLAGEGGTIVVPPSPTGEPWVLEKRFFLSTPGQTLQLKEGVVVISKPATPGLPIEEQPFAAVNTSLIRVLADNVSIIGEGTGATLAMQKAQFENSDLYVNSEFRHAVDFSGVNDFLIENVTLRDTGGDGVLVSDGPAQLFANGIIRNIVCDNCRRNGVSIVSTKSCLVEDSLFTNTGGTNPQAGLDVEPDDGNEFCEGIVIRRCSFINNVRRDLTLQLFNFHPEPDEVATWNKPIDILIDCCFTSGSGQDGFYISLARDVENGVEVTPPTDGQILVRNCSFNNAGLNEVTLSGVRADSVPILFENLQIETEANDAGFPIAFERFRRRGHGNVHILGTCHVTDCIDRPVIANAGADSNPNFPTIQNISGTIDVATPFFVRSDLGDSTENITVELLSNLVQNFGFEQWKFRWQDLGGAQITSDAFLGERAARIPDGSSGYRQEITSKMVPGLTYSLSAFSKGIPYSGMITVTFQDANGVTFDCPGFVVQGDQYTLGEVEFVAPDFATAFIELVPYCGGEFFVDQVVVGEVTTE